MIKAWILFAVAASAVPQPEAIQVQFAKQVGGKPVTVMLDGRHVKSTFAGVLGFRDRSSSWRSVCADVRSPIRQGQSFAVRPYSAGKMKPGVAKASRIVSRFLYAVESAEQCAALQLAVWEAIEDGGNQANFGAGRFQARASARVLSLAAELYQAGPPQPGGQGEQIQQEREPIYLLPVSHVGGQAQLTVRL
jgi:hypothetical protein